mmetsp:Transcript_44361/g.53606  ORF Transcript_44361/g.53606 Transcript_44361/m.53606 type:complete len:89 (-) Transcript_44361:803-1069(-)
MDRGLAAEWGFKIVTGRGNSSSINMMEGGTGLDNSALYSMVTCMIDTAGVNVPLPPAIEVMTTSISCSSFGIGTLKDAMRNDEHSLQR